MSFRYNLIQKWSKIIYRKFFPVPGSPWTMGEVDDICKINLVPAQTLRSFFTGCIEKLQAIDGDSDDVKIQKRLLALFGQGNELNVNDQTGK